MFYHIPIESKKRGPGRPRLYGNRVHISQLKYQNTVVDGKTLSVTEKKVRTRMCPGDVRLIIGRTQKKGSKTYQYFRLFTSDLDRPKEELIQHYRNRWQIETAFRDAKQHFGFDTYQLRNRQGLHRFAQLSFVATSLTQLAFTQTTTQEEQDTQVDDMSVDLDDVLQILNMHWYKAKYITRGLMTAYFRHNSQRKYFSASFEEKQNFKNNREIDEHPT